MSRDRSGCAFLLKGPLPAIQCLEELGMLYPRMVLMTLMPIIMHPNRLFGGGIKIENIILSPTFLGNSIQTQKKRVINKKDNHFG